MTCGIYACIRKTDDINRLIDVMPVDGAGHDAWAHFLSAHGPIDFRAYVGQAVDIEGPSGRWRDYRRPNPAPRQPKLRNALMKYGHSGFHFRIIEVCDADPIALNEAEVRIGILLRAIEDGYTCKLGGRAYSVVGDETRLRQSVYAATNEKAIANRARLAASRRGKPLKEQHRARILDAWERKPEEEKRAMIEAARTPEARKKISDAARARGPVSGETRRKISEAGKRRPPRSEETRRKMSEAQRGRVITEESKAKARATRANMTPEELASIRAKMQASLTNHARDARIKADLAMGQPIKHIVEAEGVSLASIHQILNRFKRDGVMVPHMLAASHRPMPVGQWHTIEMFT